MRRSGANRRERGRCGHTWVALLSWARSHARHGGACWLWPQLRLWYWPSLQTAPAHHAETRMLGIMCLAGRAIDACQPRGRPSCGADERCSAVDTEARVDGVIAAAALADQSLSHGCILDP